MKRVGLLRQFGGGRVLQRELRNTLYASGVLRGVLRGKGRQTLVAEVRASGRTRVLSVGDVRPLGSPRGIGGSWPQDLGPVRRRALGRLRGLYNRLDISLLCKGLGSCRRAGAWV